MEADRSTEKLKAPAVQVAIEWRTLEEVVATGIFFSPDGRYLAASTSGKVIALWDLETGSVVPGFDGKRQDYNFCIESGAAFSPDGKFIATYIWGACGCRDFLIRLWDARRGVPLREFKRGHTSDICSICFSPDGRLLASGSMDRTLRIWDVGSGKSIRILSTRGASDCICFSPDGRLIAFKDYHVLRLWEVQSGRPVTEFMGEGHTKPICSISFSRDGRFIASASVDHTIRKWDIGKGGPCREFDGRGHSDIVYGIAFSPCGRILASGSRDTTLRLWCAITGKLAEGTSTVTHAGAVCSVAFSPNGQLIATVDEFGIHLGKLHIQGGMLQDHITKLSNSPPTMYAPAMETTAREPLRTSPVELTWYCYILIDCSRSASDIAPRFGQGIGAFLHTLRTNSPQGINPNISFGECREVNSTISPLCRLTDLSPLSLTCAGEPTLGPPLTQLTSRIESDSAFSNGKPLAVIVLAAEPKDNFQPAAGHLAQMIAQGRVNVMAVGAGAGISDKTLSLLAKIAIRITQPHGNDAVECFEWLGKAAVAMMDSLRKSGGGKPLALPPLPPGIKLLQ